MVSYKGTLKSHRKMKLKGQFDLVQKFFFNPHKTFFHNIDFSMHVFKTPHVWIIRKTHVWVYPKLFSEATAKLSSYACASTLKRQTLQQQLGCRQDTGSLIQGGRWCLSPSRPCSPENVLEKKFPVFSWSWAHSILQGQIVPRDSIKPSFLQHPTLTTQCQRG